MPSKRPGVVSALVSPAVCLCGAGGLPTRLWYLHNGGIQSNVDKMVTPIRTITLVITVAIIAVPMERNERSDMCSKMLMPLAYVQILESRSCCNGVRLSSSR